MSPKILYLLTKFVIFNNSLIYSFNIFINILNILINFIGATKTLGDDADRLVGLSRKSSRNNF